MVVRGSDGVRLLRDCVATLEKTEVRLDHTRALLELGVALRHQGVRPEARDLLRAALDAAARMGASGLADRAHQELIATGARPRRNRRMLSGRESLTAGEDRAALLAAQGLTNREIAQRQFVTVKAVQRHLRNIYRKLDVSSREELPAVLTLGSQAETLGWGDERRRGVGDRASPTCPSCVPPVGGRPQVAAASPVKEIPDESVRNPTSPVLV